MKKESRRLRRTSSELSVKVFKTICRDISNGESFVPWTMLKYMKFVHILIHSNTTSCSK